MCGIIWLRRTDNKSARKAVLKKFEAQRGRGVQGFGMLFISKDQNIEKWKQTQNEKEMKELMSHATVPEMMFHHRYPTSTPNVLEATHPILISHDSLKYDYYVVHNGVIHNADELIKEYKKEGFEFNTEVQTKYIAKDNEYFVESKINDSEAFAIDIAKAIEDEKIDQIESRGSIAFIAIQTEKGKTKILNMFCGRNYLNPLIFNKNSHSISLTSEGNGQEIEAHMLFKMNYKDNKLEEVRELMIGSYYSSNRGLSDKVEPEKLPLGKGYGDDYYSSIYDDEDDEYSIWDLYAQFKNHEEFESSYIEKIERCEMLRDYLRDSVDEEEKQEYKDEIDLLVWEMKEYEKIYDFFSSCESIK